MISKTKCSVEASITLARNISASRNASIRFSPLPTTLISASSRSSASPTTREIDHAMHVDQPFQLALDLRQHHGRARRDDGEAREVLLVLGLRHGEAVDVVAAAREQAGDARQHARLVVDQDGERVASRASPCVPRGSRRSRVDCLPWRMLFRLEFWSRDTLLGTRRQMIHFADRRPSTVCGTSGRPIATPAPCLPCRRPCRSPRRSRPRPAASRCAPCPRGSWGSNWRAPPRGSRTAPACRRAHSASP